MYRLDPAMPLKPQSVCLRMILCEQNTNLPQREFKNPFLNFKIEFGSDCSKKRPLQDSTSDDGYETPAKKMCSPKDLSPDLGCFMDYSSRVAATEDSVSTSAISIPALLDKVQTICSEMNEGAGPPLHDVKCGPSIELGVHKQSVPHGLSCDDVLVNLLPAFDCDVEDILGLDASDNIENKCPSSNTFLQNLSLIMSGSVLESHTAHVEALEGITEEGWDIGSPIFESSIFHASVVGEEDLLESSYETTLPLQVKVKSVVVDPSQQASSSETAAAPPPLNPSPDENRGSRTVKLVSSAVRPKGFGSEREWDHAKRLYVHSVTRHMMEHQGENNGVMSELRNLMNQVAGQRQGPDGKRWHHPSDLTRREYQKRFGNEGPRMSIWEWQALNRPEYKRFAEVPAYFQRSHFLNWD